MVQSKIGIAAIIVSLLSACDSETLNERKEQNQENQLTASTRVTFDPANSVLSVPNDILFSETEDGTLNLPVVDAANFSDPTVALSALDGWSFQQPFVIDFTVTSEAGGLDAQSAQTPNAIRIFKAIMGGSSDVNHPECAEKTRGTACKIIEELTFGPIGDFVTQLASDSSVAVIPMRPFEAGVTYLVMVSDILQDGLGRSVQPSASYLTLRQDVKTAPLATDSQLALQATINSYEQVLSDFGVAQSDIIFSSAMTVQSKATLPLMKQLLVKNPAQLPQMTPPVATGLDVKTALQPSSDSCQNILEKIQSGTASTAEQGIVGFCAAQLYQSSIDLPYYSGIASADKPTGATGDGAWWQAMCDSGATLQGVITAGVTLPAEPQSESDAMCMSFGLRDLPDLQLDTERNITQYNPVPKIRGIENVNVQITVPDPVIATALKQETVEMPENGWPVVIMQHGIGNKKEGMLPVTAALSLAGFATVSIDMVLHGERGFDVTGDGEVDVVADENSVTAYMNLQNIRAIRDNLRQSVVDLLRLRLAVATLGQTEFNNQKVDNSRVYFLGHSLGGLVGTAFTALTNTSLAAQVDPLFKVQAAVLANTSGGIGSFLLESGSFGKFIKGSVLLSNYSDFITYLTQVPLNPATVLADQGEYAQQRESYLAQAGLDNEALSLFAIAEGYFLFLAQQGVDVLALGAEQHNQYLDVYLATLQTDQLNAVNDLINGYAFAAQAAVDAGDPNRYTESYTATQTPTLITEIWGDGTPATWDQVIPPVSSLSPMSGTENLARLLGIPKVSESVSGNQAQSALIRFNTGNHISLVSPAASAEVTQEMQNLIATYLATNAQVVKITDSEVIAN
ncbi:VolA/Pla-1 family phospholipase [Catenovulum sediminis]|uniref:VolA/Pla-1 family phospholipase n=1 Tax=Catenovulum sediminis TaxID=1740262 RepID=A0ABV1RLW1_9ALTE